MYLINKRTFTHIGIEAEDTAATLPAGLYTAVYNRMQQTTTFEEAASGMSKYIELDRDIQGTIQEEIDYFFTQERQRGILIHGEPGNGKTRLLSEIINNYAKKHNAIALLGPKVENITSIIKAVRIDDPERYLIIFWDEFDEILNEDEWEMLRFLDGAESVVKCLTVAALNDIEEVPERIYKRPGRFGLVGVIGNPDHRTRLRLIEDTIKDSTVAEQIATLTEGLSLDYVREIVARHTVRGQSIERIFECLALSLPNATQKELDDQANSSIGNDESILH